MPTSRFSIRRKPTDEPPQTPLLPSASPLADPGVSSSAGLSPAASTLPGDVPGRTVTEARARNEEDSRVDLAAGQRPSLSAPPFPVNADSESLLSQYYRPTQQRSPAVGLAELTVTTSWDRRTGDARRNRGQVGTAASSASAVGALQDVNHGESKARGTGARSAKSQNHDVSEDGFLLLGGGQLKTQHSSAVALSGKQVIREGSFEKWTNSLRRYKRRHFTVVPGAIRYSDPGNPGRKPDMFDLTTGQIKQQTGENVITLESRGRTLRIKFPNPEEKSEWVRAIEEAKQVWERAKLMSDSGRTASAEDESDLAAEALEVLQPYANEKNPMGILGEFSMRGRSKFHGVLAGVRDLQRKLLVLAGHVKDTAYKEGIKDISLEMVQRLDRLSDLTERLLNAVDAMVVEESDQRKCLEKSIKALGKKCYYLEIRLHQLQTFITREADDEFVMKLGTAFGHSVTKDLFSKRASAVRMVSASTVGDHHLGSASFTTADVPPVYALGHPGPTGGVYEHQHNPITSQQADPLETSIDWGTSAAPTVLGAAAEAVSQLRVDARVRKPQRRRPAGGLVTTFSENSSDDDDGTPEAGTERSYVGNDGSVSESGSMGQATRLDATDDDEVFYDLDEEEESKRLVLTQTHDALAERASDPMRHSKGPTSSDGAVTAHSPPLIGNEQGITPDRNLRQDLDLEAYWDTPGAVSCDAGGSAERNESDGCHQQVTQPSAVSLFAGGRTCLPKPRTEFKVSLWSVLKGCVGRDLSRISMPVYFNEPTSFLQRLTEDFQYCELLRKASQCPNSIDRLLLVTMFSISPYASANGRTYKPFNPLLGETYEYSHRGFRFVAEQVGHHPPCSAYYADSPSFISWGDTVVKTRFFGKSVELSVLGPIHVVLATPHKYEEAEPTAATQPPQTDSAESPVTKASDHNPSLLEDEQQSSTCSKRKAKVTGERFVFPVPIDDVPYGESSVVDPNVVKDHYSYNRARLAVNNVIFGRLTIEMLGTITVTNHVTGDFAIVEFVRSGWWNRETHSARGLILTNDCRMKYRLGGHWSRCVWCERVIDETRGLTISLGTVETHQTATKHESSGPRRGSKERVLSQPTRRSDAGRDEDGTPVQGSKGKGDSNGGHASQKLRSESIAASDDFLVGHHPRKDISNLEIQWDLVLSDPSSRTVLWQPEPRPANASSFYEFGRLTMELNELSHHYDPTKGASMPRTDSRFRPDQRALEEGDCEKASAEKNRLEEKQRRAAQRLYPHGEEHREARWFTRYFDTVVNEPAWRFTQDYWKCKKMRNFANCPDIFSSDE